MEQHIFCIFIDYRGHHRKGVAIYKTTQGEFLTETLVSLNKKCIFDHYREFQARKSLLIDIIFAMKRNYCRPFQSCHLYGYVNTTPRCTIPLNIISDTIKIEQILQP
jgi:hypothetical protein